jgi:RIO kinase 1
MTVRELFNFVTDLSITNDNIDAYLDEAMRIAAERPPDDDTDRADEEVFKKAFIPRKLNDVVDFERDLDRIREGIDTDLIFYPTVIGMKTDLSGVLDKPSILGSTATPSAVSNDNDDDNDDDDSTSSSGEGSASDGEDGSRSDSDHVRPEDDEGGTTTHCRPRGESPNSRKERKKLVKEAQREKRKTKVPKYQKKRHEKVAKLKK